ncbi:MAG: transketolase, partial [Deltaproteobacteria bacterium]|nr:transketolase [Deltaproteobacteria bacterium]
LGEDGPTHQPIEHLASLRAIPNLTVIRPADANETVEAWKVALNRNGPTALILTRQKLPTIDRDVYSSTAADVSKGAYVLADTDNAQAIIIATGSEVELALAAHEELKEQGINTRVVNMPSSDLFEEQESSYRESVLPRNVRARVTVEAGATQGWHKYAGIDGEVIGIDRFGASAPYKTIYEKFGITVEEVVGRVKSLTQ